MKTILVLALIVCLPMRLAAAASDEEQKRRNSAQNENPDGNKNANKNTTIAASKLSADLNALIKSPNAQVTLGHNQKKGDAYLIEITIKGDSSKLIALLKQMGLEVVSTSSNGHKIKAYVTLAKVSEIAAQDFVLHLSLASDRK